MDGGASAYLEYLDEDDLVWGSEVDFVLGLDHTSNHLDDCF